MVALRLSIVAGELSRRMRERLRGAGSITQSKVVWQEPGRQLLIHTDTLNARFVDGWLICNLDVETDQTRRTTIQFVYFVGKTGDGDGMQAGATINAPTMPSAQIAACWGEDLQRVLWDAVLDAIEACIHRAGEQQRGQKLTLQGFYCSNDAVHVHVLAGEI